MFWSQAQNTWTLSFIKKIWLRWTTAQCFKASSERKCWVAVLPPVRVTEPECLFGSRAGCEGPELQGTVLSPTTLMQSFADTQLHNYYGHISSSPRGQRDTPFGFTVLPSWEKRHSCLGVLFLSLCLISQGFSRDCKHCHPRNWITYNTECLFHRRHLISTNLSRWSKVSNEYVPGWPLMCLWLSPEMINLGWAGIS